MRVMIRTICVALGIGIVLALPGCILDERACESTGSKDFRGHKLRLLDHGAFDYMYGAIHETFEKKTGAELELVSGGDAGSALRRAIDSQGNPVADLIYGVDNALFHQGARAGLFEAYASPNLGRIAPDIRVDDFRQDGLLLATPADHGYVTVNYDVRLRSQYPEGELPMTLEDLSRPQWARTFVVEDPRTSSPGLGFLVATVASFGVNDAYDFEDYWRDLFQNGVLVVSDWTTAYVVHYSAGYGQGLAGFVGDRQIVVSYSTSPAYEAWSTGDAAAAPPSVSLEPPKGSFHQTETVAILKCTKELPLAQAFVDFVLSQEFQDEVWANMAVYPAAAGSPIPSAAAQHATDPSDMEPAPFTSADLDENVADWVQAWVRMYQAYRA